MRGIEGNFFFFFFKKKKGNKRKKEVSDGIKKKI
jgi:hypothetical protein